MSCQGRGRKQSWTNMRFEPRDWEKIQKSSVRIFCAPIPDSNQTRAECMSETLGRNYWAKFCRYIINSILQVLIFIITKRQTQHLIQTRPLHCNRNTAVCFCKISFNICFYLFSSKFFSPLTPFTFPCISSQFNSYAQTDRTGPSPWIKLTPLPLPKYMCTIVYCKAGIALRQGN
jgi:hypothetical protein